MFTMRDLFRSWREHGARNSKTQLRGSEKRLGRRASACNSDCVPFVFERDSRFLFLFFCMSYVTSEFPSASRSYGIPGTIFKKVSTIDAQNASEIRRFRRF